MGDKVAIKINTFALGDSICAIPTINKLSEFYSKPITVFNDWSHLLVDHPSVSECKKLNDSTEGYLVHDTFEKFLSNGHEKKHNAIDIRQYHAWDLGISLTNDEMDCDLYCEEEKDIGISDYVIIHPSKTWESRTWPESKWQELTDKLISLGLKVVIIGNDNGQKEWNEDKKIWELKNVHIIKGGIDLVNKTSIPELRWMMNHKAFCVITMDSGILHVAGTTDCNIIQLGSSLNYKLRAPYRKGKQDYKYQYIGGTCNIACASNLKYGLKEHGDIHGIPVLRNCQEEYDEFLCHSSVNDVIKSVKNINGFENINKNKYIDNNQILISYLYKPRVEIKGKNKGKYKIEFIDKLSDKVVHSSEISNNMWTECNREWFTNWVIKINGKIVDEMDLTNKQVHIELCSKSIGDTIAWAPYAVEFMKKHKCKVSMSTFHNDWFENIPEYKDITLLKPGSGINAFTIYQIGWFKNLDKNNWDRSDLNKTPVNLIPLQQTATDALGLEHKEINYGVDLGKGKRPIKNKYVVFGPQATAGCKEWDYDKWVELSKIFIDKGYKVVICSVKKYNIPNTINSNGSLENTANYLKHADVFVGLGSGLSWLNWALGKHTYMINGFAKEGHEFTSKLTKITNDLCIKCWNDPVHVFDPGDWNWCPVYKGTKLQHICQKSITSKQVFNIIQADLDLK